MSQSNRVTMALFAVCALFVVSAVAQAQVTDQQIREAIRKGVAYIYSQQNNNGNWEEGTHAEKQPCGLTSLACYGLLSAGEEWQNNPKLRNAMEFLEHTSTEATYAVGLRAHVWAKLPDAFMPPLRNDGNLLANGQGPSGRFTYQLGRDGDHSCTQYGTLGAWEAAKRGVDIPTTFWKKAEDNFVNTQNADGGWTYNPAQGGDSRLTMAAAGLTVLFITQDYLHTQDYKRAGVAAKHPLQQRINLGLDWFHKNFNGRGGGGYSIVGIERVGLASGYKYLNDIDWFKVIAAERIRTQKGDGSWGGGRSGVIETSFTLVFLSRGRAPVFANKLEIDDFDWNNRPRDLANLTQWFADDVEHAMNWQIVTLHAPAEDWLDAPLLYIASHRPLELTEEQEQQIKRYIDLGGLVVTTADEGGQAFTSSVEKLMAKLYPQYELKQVADDDPLYNLHFSVGPRDVPAMSVHNGVRHLLVHLPKDVSWTFHSSDHRKPAAWQLAANIYHYATEKGITRAKLDHHFEKVETQPTRTIKVAKAKYEGNWNAEPLALEVLSNYASNHHQVGLDVTEAELADLANAGTSLVHLTGTATVELSAEQVKAIYDYAQTGVVLIESPGGKGDFATAVQKALAADGQHRFVPLQTTHPVLTGAGYGGSNISQVDYRKYFKLRLGPSHQPGLQAIMINGQPRIILSVEDISEGILDQPVWGVFGYDSESSRKIGTNIAMWAASLPQQ